MWFVYLAQGCDGQLYCGITTNTARRIKEHNTSKRGAKWAKAHRPLKLVWTEEHESRSEASKREAQIKKMDKIEKRKLIYEKE
ncbi:MAG: GIY-YIG nuclease family protein [Patescibacteria group bacterium]|jgi:putative endonuclease